MSRVSEIVVCKGLRHLRHAGKHCQRAGDIRLKHLPLPAIDANLKINFDSAFASTSASLFKTLLFPTYITQNVDLQGFD